MKGKRSRSKLARNGVLLIQLVFLLLLAAQSLAEELKIGIGIEKLQVNQSQKEQVSLPSINAVTNASPNISMNVPMSYLETGLRNITIKKTSFGFKNPQNIQINESGVIKNATVVGDDVTWEANLSAGSAALIFNLLPPVVSQESAIITNTTNATTFEKNFTVSAEESFTNVSITISVNDSYEFWTLWHYNGTDFIDKTVVLHLQVSNGIATFYNVSTSTQLFKLTGNTTCTERWSCTAWSDAANSCGTRTCTDANHCGTTDSKPAESTTCPSTSGGGGGGGGGGGAAPKTAKAFSDFEISEQLISEELRGDGIIKRAVTIKNTGTNKLELKIDFSGVKDFVITPEGVSTLEMKLAPGEESSFDIIVFGSGLKKAGVYSGNIVVNGEGIEKRVNLVLDYESSEPLFDVEINLPERYSKVFPGDHVYTEIRLFNLKGIGKVDVKVNYSIKDSEGVTISSGSTLLAVQTQASIVRSLSIPSKAKPGNYIFSVEAEYGGIIGTGSEVFEVVEMPPVGKGAFEMPKIFTFGIISLIALLAVLVAISAFDMLAHHKILGPKIMREREHKLERLSEEELRKQLKLLEDSFESGLISARAYIEDKTKIEGMLKRIKK